MSPAATDVTLTVIILERVVDGKRSKNTKIKKAYLFRFILMMLQCDFDHGVKKVRLDPDLYFFLYIVTGEVYKDAIPNTSGNMAWANDNKTLYYAVKDETLRSYKIFKHKLGTAVKDDQLIFHEDDPSLPVYSAHYDYDMLPSDRGGFLTFHWHGYTELGERPLPGKYTVVISACSPDDPLTVVASVVETDAIWIEVVDVEIDAASDTLFSLNSAEEEADSLDIVFETSNYFTSGDLYDYAELVIWTQGADPETDPETYREPVADPLSGTHSWNGELAPDIFLAPGHYSAQIEVFKEGHLLGKSPMHDFTAYRINCALTGIAEDDEYFWVPKTIGEPRLHYFPMDLVLLN